MIVIDENTRQILVGILLGDAHISQRSPTANSRLSYAQTSEKHGEYFSYVFNVFSFFCVNNYEPKIKNALDKRSNKVYTSISFATMQLPCFNEYKRLFYPHGFKVVPCNIYELLTPKGLAF